MRIHRPANNNKPLLFLLALSLVLALSLKTEAAHAGWKTKAVLAAGTVIAGRALKKCITSNGCQKKALYKIESFIAKHPELRQKLLNKIQEQASKKHGHLINKSTQNRINYEKILHSIDNRAYTTAKNGGKHAGYLKNNTTRSNDELIKGINSLEKQITLHREKTRAPEKYIKDWNTLHPARKDALLTKKWPSDIQRQTEQRDLFRGILSNRN